MRKYLFISLAFLCVLNLCYFCNIEPLKADEATYYRVTSDNTILYRTPVDSTESSNVYFILPTTYFVLYNSTFDEQFLCVTYREFTGYVLVDSVTRVYSTPTNPYALNLTFSVSSVANLVLRSEPTTQSDYLGTIPINADVEYFGRILGEQSNSELSNVWYYCRYKSFEQGILTGYVYAPLTQDLTELIPNTEEVETEPSKTTNTETIIASELQSGVNLVLILGLTIPALLLLILVFRPERRKKKREASRQITQLNKLSLPSKNNDNEFDF